MKLGQRKRVTDGAPFTDRKVTVIIPKEGVNNEWDDLNEQITSMKTAFNKHLAQMKLELK